jgi:7,8-dihydroneopterin aldolase/epimerase/oxygenase
MYTITIQDLHSESVIGVFAHERSAPQDLFIDLSITIEREVQDDSLNTTLDYTQAISMVKEIAKTTNYLLIETLARHIKETCVALPGVASAVVTIRKPGASSDARVSVTYP